MVMTRQLGGRRDREVDREFFLNIQLFGRFQDFLFVIYVFLHLWRRRATKEIDMPRRVPPPRDQGKLATVARAAPKSAIEKSAYMTRDAVRRLKKAKKAAKSILVSGGTLADAAQAAQAYGTPAEGDNSDASDTGDDDELSEQVHDSLQLAMAPGAEDEDDDEEQDPRGAAAGSSQSKSGPSADGDGGGAVMIT